MFDGGWLVGGWVGVVFGWVLMFIMLMNVELCCVVYGKRVLIGFYRS